MFLYVRRLLKKEPAIHHAVHLASVRGRCGNDPMKILTKYVVGLDQQQPTRAATAALSGSKSTAAATTGGIKGDTASETVLLEFDDIDKVTEKIFAMEAREVFDDVQSAEVGSSEATAAADRNMSAATIGGWASMFSKSTATPNSRTYQAKN